MKRLYNTIIILYFISIIPACERYYVGNIIVTTTNFTQLKSEFSYVISNKRIILQGKLDDEFFSGDIYPVDTVRKVEIHRYPGVDKKNIKKHTIFAFTRLTGNKGNMIECFIKQNSKRNLKSGGVGRCYQQNGKTFDIELKPTS